MSRLKHVAGGAAPALFVAGDQASFSIGNFLTFVLVARLMDVREVGLFAAIQSSLFLAIVAHSALITEPMGVFFSSRYRTTQAAYAVQTAKLHVLVALAMALPSLAVLAYLLRDHHLLTLDLTASMIAVMPLVLAIWLIRRWAYNLRAAHLAAGFSLANGTLCLGAVAFLDWIDRLDALSALWALAFAAAACTLPGLPLLLARTCKPAAFRLTTGNVALAHWTFGRWLLMGSLPHYFAQQWPLMVLTRTHGLDATAEFRALSTLILPILLLLPAAAAYLIPFVAADFADNREEQGKRKAYTLQAVFLCGVVVFIPVMALSGNWLMRVVYGGRFADAAPLLPLLSGALIPGVLGLAPGILLRAANWTPPLAVVPLLTALTAFAITQPLVQWLGMAGAVNASVAIAAANAVFLYGAYWHWRRTRSGGIGKDGRLDRSRTDGR